MDKFNLFAPFIGLCRHRIQTDGEGVTTLAAFHGCPLHCRYCLNPQCHSSPDHCLWHTPGTLYQEVILKEIRSNIAQRNEIDFCPQPCNFEGDCTGTCPQCEAELHYLERQIALRRAAGKAITLIGISAATMQVNAIPQEAPSMPHIAQEQSDTTSVTLTGTVKDSNGEPLPGANIVEKGTHNGTVTDRRGRFKLKVSGKSPIIIRYIGMNEREIPTDSLTGKTLLSIVMQEVIPRWKPGIQRGKPVSVKYTIPVGFQLQK